MALDVFALNERLHIVERGDAFVDKRMCLRLTIAAYERLHGETLVAEPTCPPLRVDAPKPMLSASHTTTSRPARASVKAAIMPV